MKKKLSFRFLILPIIITLFLLIPENVVWGGLNYQTVPTIGPTNTPTRTKTSTATQPFSTQTSVGISTSTSVSISTMVATATSTAEATQEILSENSQPEKTASISIIEESPQSESTSVVVLPVVSNGDSAPDEQSGQDSNTPIPAFVFPLVVVLLFVIIYLSTRLSLKKSQDEIQPK
ncbi:MAG: hypothetical protein CVU41_16645 [Chloroflexi bacterium HGW-Chloroflexi-3]|nr:MAG: hypothetical protein CVU41_16645 [Chloroflexi bacterium HGW-Chloroflexi-3]